MLFSYEDPGVQSGLSSRIWEEPEGILPFALNTGSLLPPNKHSKVTGAHRQAQDTWLD